MVTPANGGYHGRPPPRNLCGDAGQRPTIYRLQRCRGHRGPRTSATPAGTGRRGQTNPLNTVLHPEGRAGSQDMSSPANAALQPQGGWQSP